MAANRTMSGALYACTSINSTHDDDLGSNNGWIETYKHDNLGDDERTCKEDNDTVMFVTVVYFNSKPESMSNKIQ